MLYAVDLRRAPTGDLDQHIEDYWRELSGEIDGRPFADELVRAVMADVPAIDARIVEVSRNWRLERMACVDRNVLRIGVHELTAEPSTPRAVVIDEAVELAKRFGAEGSALFVNGLLDRIAEDLGRD